MAHKIQHTIMDNLTNRGRAVRRLQSLRHEEYSDTTILEHLIYNYLSGTDALEALEDFTHNEH